MVITMMNDPALSTKSSASMDSEPNGTAETGRTSVSELKPTVTEELMTTSANTSPSPSSSPSPKASKASKASKATSFFGRDAELQHLRKIWRRINKGKPVIPAALVWGTSGTGKSQLIDHFLNQVNCSCEGGHQTEQANAQRPCSCRYVLRGKYDEYTGSKDPFSAIIQALDDFATQLKQGPSEELQRIQEAIEDVFSAGADAGFSLPNKDDANRNDAAKQSYSAVSALIAVVPSLDILFSTSTGASSIPPVDISSSNLHQQSGDAGMDTASVSTCSVRDHGKSDSMTDIGYHNRHTKKKESPSSSKSAWNRLCYIFIQFIKAVSTPQRPVFLFLDDLQWSSAAGLELLASLLNDTDLHNFMLLGAIRQETDPHNHQAMELLPEAPLQRSFLDRLVNQSSAGTNANINANGQKGNDEGNERTLEQVTIGPLPLPDCTLWLSRLLHRSYDDDDLKALASKIHKKTHGNVYFTLQAVEELKRSNIIIYNSISDRWEWDLSQSTNGGSEELPIGDNIVAIIEVQLRSLPHDLQRVLSVAAYIRSTFDLHVLQVVLQHIDDHGGIEMESEEEGSGTKAAATPPLPSSGPLPWTSDRLCVLLDQALLGGLVTNSIGESRYHFAHDRVQQAAYGLIPFGEIRSKLRLQIGRCLLDMYRMSKATPAQEDDQEEHNRQQAQQQQQRQNDHSVKDIDSLLFVAADHLNSVRTKDHLFLVSFNLEVGQKALQMAALASASSYLQKASDALQRVRNPWTEHYETCLTLFQCRSEVELSLGNFELGHSAGNEIIERAQEFDEKLPTYHSMAVALGREGKAAESMSISLSVAQKLGESPKRFYLYHVVNDVMQIKAFLRNNTDEEILNLPAQEDHQKTMALKFLDELIYRSFFSGNWLSWMVHNLKRVRMTMKYGIDDESPSAFATLSVFWDVTNQESALMLRCAGIAHKLLGRAGGKRQTSVVYGTTAGWVYPHTEPFSKCIKTLEKGHSLAMEVGDFGLGLTDLQLSNTLAFYFGYKLQPLVTSLENALQQYTIYNVSFSNEVTIALLMMSKHFAGMDPIEWEVFERNVDHDLAQNVANKDEAHRLAATYSGLPFLAMLFRRHELAQRMLKLYRKVSVIAKGYGTESATMLAQGLTSAALFRTTGRAKHKNSLKQQIGLARELVTKKGSNTTSLLQLLKAERLSLKPITSNSTIVGRTEQAYGIAIAMAEKASLIHYCAIACEQLAEYLLRAKKILARNKGGPNIQPMQTALHESICKYMAQAAQLYEDWGCTIKVEDIRNRRSKYLQADADNGEIQLRLTGGGGGGGGGGSRVVDVDMHSKMSSTANSGVPSVTGRTAQSGTSTGDRDGKWLQKSLRQGTSIVEGDDGMLYVAGDTIDDKSAPAQSNNDNNNDDADDVSVLTEGSEK